MIHTVDLLHGFWLLYGQHLVMSNPYPHTSLSIWSFFSH